MKSDRRTFLRLAGGAAAALSAGDLFGAATPSAQITTRAPEAALVALADVALSTAKKLDASYADISQSVGNSEQLQWVNDTGMICVDPGTLTIDDGDPFGVTIQSVWGIDGTTPYYDDAFVADGDEAALFYDPLVAQYTLIAYDF